MKVHVPVLAVVTSTLLQGCAAVSDTKSLVITPRPGQTEVVVASNASARCRNILTVITCRLDVDIHEVTDTINQTPPPAAVAPVGGAPDTNATKRLEQLDELKRKGLISEREYQMKRQEILRGL